MSTHEADDPLSSSRDDSAEYISDDQQMQGRVCGQRKSGYEADIGERSPTSMPGKRLAPSTRPTTGVLAPRGYQRRAEVEPRLESICRREDSDPPQPTGLQSREGVRSQRMKDTAWARSGACAWPSPLPEVDTSETSSGHLEVADDDDDSHFSGESDERTESPIEDGVASSPLDHVLDDFEEEYESQGHESSDS